MSLLFFKEAVRKFKTQGSLFPSSAALGRMMIRPLHLKPGSVVVELGAGTGSVTREIVVRLPAGAKLIAFENNAPLAALLRAEFEKDIRAHRVEIIEDDAGLLGSHLKRLGFSGADYIVSGLPLGNFTRRERQRIFDAISASLADEGLYIQFQYVLASWAHIRELFDARIIGYEIRNVPPAFVYACRKK